MTVRKLSFSLTPELADALDALATARDEGLSRVVETLLREHALVHTQILGARPDATTEHGPPQYEWVGRKRRLHLV